VIHVRGMTVHSTAHFVRERFGPEAHARVMDGLPLEVQLTFHEDVRDAAWRPLDHVAAYMRLAHLRLAPGDDAFHRLIGRYSGDRIAKSPFRTMLGTSPLSAVGRANFMWRFLYDTGRPETVSKRPGEIVVRIVDFPNGDRIWCDRICGFLESLTEAAGGRQAEVREIACRAQGAAHCEVRGTWV